MEGVPVEVITPNHPYWNPEWVDIPDLIRPQLETWQERKKAIYSDPHSNPQQRSLATRQCNRGKAILDYFTSGKAGFSIYQIVAKKHIHKSLVQYDTIFRVVQILEELTKFRNVEVTPLEWIRERLAQYFAATPADSKFSVSKALKDMYHDEKLAYLRQQNGFRHVGRPLKRQHLKMPVKGKPAITPANSARGTPPTNRGISTGPETPSRPGPSPRTMGSSVSTEAGQNRRSPRTTTGGQNSAQVATAPAEPASSRKTKERVTSLRHQASQNGGTVSELDGEGGLGPATGTASNMRALAEEALLVGRNNANDRREEVIVVDTSDGRPSSMHSGPLPKSAGRHPEKANKAGGSTPHTAVSDDVAVAGSFDPETCGRARQRRGSIRDHSDMPKIPNHYNNASFQVIEDDAAKRDAIPDKKEREEREKDRKYRARLARKREQTSGNVSDAEDDDSDYYDESSRSESRGRSTNPRKRRHSGGSSAGAQPASTKIRTKFRENYSYDEDTAFDIDGYTSSDSFTNGPISEADFRLLQVRTKQHTTNPSVTQYWNFLGSPDFIFEHQVLEAVKPRIKWGKYNDELNFHLRLDEMVEIWYTAQNDPETDEPCRKIKITMREATSPRHNRRPGTWFVDNPDRAVEDEALPVNDASRGGKLKVCRPKKYANAATAATEADKPEVEENGGKVELDAHDYPVSKGRGDVFAEFKRLRTMQRFIEKCELLGVRITRVP